MPYPNRKSKRFWLFGAAEYEAYIGMKDFIADFDTLDEARSEVERLKASRDYMDPCVEWWQIIDIDAGEEVARGRD